MRKALFPSSSSVRTTVQIASNLASRRLIRPNADILVLAGGSGSLKREPTFHFYNWVSREFDAVYTLLDEGDSYSVFEGVLPRNVYALNHGIHPIGPTGHFITGQRTGIPDSVDLAVFRGYPRRQQVDYAPVNVFQRGIDWSRKNGVVCLANDATHLLFDPERIYHIQ